MSKKLFTLFLFVIFAFTLVNAQEKTFMRPDGKFYRADHYPTSEEVMKMKTPLMNREVMDMPSASKSIFSPAGVIDTLRYPDGNTNFGFFGQDAALQWFVAPADLTIKGFAYYSTDNTGAAGGGWEAKIVTVNLTETQLKSFGDNLIGYYPADGNGFTNVTYYLDEPDRTGEWFSYPVYTMGEPFGHDIWSDGGYGAPTVPVLNEYVWVQTNILFEPTINEGEVFGISLKNVSTVLNGDRLGLLSGVFGFPGWKFYSTYRLQNDGSDKGWWTRTYSWNLLVEVDITGNIPPKFEDVTVLPSGIDYGPWTVDAVITDVDPGTPANAGVASASLFWSLDGDNWNEVVMTGSMPNYSAEIPAQAPGSTVSYYLEATDLGGKTSVSQTYSFYLFSPSGANTLVVFNGWDAVTGYPVTYYFGSGQWPANYTRFDFVHDKWGYGELTEGVVNNYTNIVEIATNGPSVLNSDVIRTWLEADGSRNYMLAGDEWLGAQTNWTDRSYDAGTFHYDILGITADYNDINYGVSGDQNLPSEVFPQQGSALGGPIYDLYVKVSADSNWTAPMRYDPYYEIEVANWLDGVDFLGDVQVDIKGKPKTGQNKNIGGHRTLPAGNKIAFFSYDPLSLNSSLDPATHTQYYWYGFSDKAPQVETLKWFGVTTGVVKENDLIPGSFDLKQNYPNPFNPSTTISFSIPQNSRVVLKVYDVLGREVATLLNEDKVAGNYMVDFDASKLASGLYIYSLNAENFTATKKMMLIK